MHGTIWITKMEDFDDDLFDDELEEYLCKNCGESVADWEIGLNGICDACHDDMEINYLRSH